MPIRHIKIGPILFTAYNISEEIGGHLGRKVIFGFGSQRG